jgi:hypothetical protein
LTADDRGETPLHHIGNGGEVQEQAGLLSGNISIWLVLVRLAFRKGRTPAAPFRAWSKKILAI